MLRLARAPLALALACLAACAQRQPMQELRAEYQALRKLQALRAWYAATRGEAGEVLLAPAGLSRPGAIGLLERAVQAPGLDAGEALALRFLRRALAADEIALATAPLDAEAARIEVEATVRWDGAPLAFRDIPMALKSEPDSTRRRALDALATGVYAAQLNPILLRRQPAEEAAARRSGFSSFIALSEDLREVRLTELLRAGAAYVRATDSLYAQLLDRLAREDLGIPGEELRAADLPRLWSAPRLCIEPGAALPVLRSFLAGIGLDLRTAAGTEVRIDDARDPRKRNRAFVEAVDAPADVRLSVKPSGGLDDEWTLFHEAGHAVHFAWATVRPPELRTMGYGAPAEAFGELFRAVFTDPLWLARYAQALAELGVHAPGRAGLASILRHTALLEMYQVRRYAFAKVAYEMRLHGSPLSSIEPALALLGSREGLAGDSPEALRALYRALFARAGGFPLDAGDAERYLADVDPTFASADYARAFALAGMLHEAIRARFGPDWTRNAEVGRFLRVELFAQGTALSPEDVTERLGFGRTVDFDFAARRAGRLAADADRLERAAP